MKPIQYPYLQVAIVTLAIASVRAANADQPNSDPTEAQPVEATAIHQTEAPAASATGTPKPAIPAAADSAPVSSLQSSVSNVEREPGGDVGTGKKKKDKRDRKRRSENATIDEDDGIALGDPWGDDRDEFGIAGLSFRFLGQSRYQQTLGARSSSADRVYRDAEVALAEDRDGWDLNRMFFRILAEPSRYLALKMVTDFSEFRHNDPKRAVKQANVELRILPKHFHVVAGVLKVPFDIFELDPISKFEFASFGQANELVNYLGFAGRDVGAEVVVSPLAKPRYFNLVAGAFRGHATGENASFVGAVGARMESEPVKGYRAGISWLGHPERHGYIEPFDTSDEDLLPHPANLAYARSRSWDKGNAFSADLTVSRWGLTLRAEGLTGTRVDLDTQYGAQKWAAAWAIAAYKFPVGRMYLQPALRAEFLDTDLEHNKGLRRQWSVALSLFVSKSVRLMLDATRTDVQANSPVVEQPPPLREQPYNDLSNTRVTSQLQVVL